jgi:uncharacterized surface protein with fasciclin (FAS1) repeats
MMKEKLNYKSSLLALALIIAVFGCTKKMDEKYQEPPWLKGDNIETLEKAEKYTIFLDLMKMAGFDQTVKKQLSTLFAPDDDAFKAYFQKRGISSIRELSDEEADELFKLHYLKDPVNATHLVYEKAWKRLESPIGEYKSFFFRKQTTAFSPPYIEVPKYDKTFKDKEIYIYTGLKYVPVFSKLFFDDYNANGDIDYPFMYPESNWGGLLQWHSARVKLNEGKENSTNIEDAVTTTSSGFIFYIDRVIEPMPSVEQYLSKNLDKYGLFYDLMQRFASYTYEKTDNKGRLWYTKKYSDISNIASEAGPGGSIPASMLYTYTLFAPDDALLKSYLDNTALKTYEAIDSIPDITIRYILQSQISNRLEFKSKFTKEFFNYYGDQSVIDANDVEPGFMCSNGVIYKSKKMLEPNAFLCVPGPLFFSKSHSTFVTLLSNTSLIATLSSTDRKLTLFAPNNENFETANIRIFLTSDNKYEFQERRDDGTWQTYIATELTSFAQDHIFSGELPDLSGDGYIEMLSHNFVHYSNNVITGGFNENLGTNATITGSEVKKNGTLYYIEKPIRTRYRMGQYIASDPDLSKFAALLVKAGVLDLNFKETDTKNAYPHIKVTEEPGLFYWTAFAPTNAAIDAAAAAGLDTAASTEAGKAALKSFVNNHFIQKTIFDDGKVSGSFKTQYGSYLNITNAPGNLQVTDKTGQTVTVNHADADHLVRRGVVHKITSVLKYK